MYYNSVFIRYTTGKRQHTYLEQLRVQQGWAPVSPILLETDSSQEKVLDDEALHGTRRGLG